MHSGSAFKFGDFTVEPAQNSVSCGERIQTLEPRAMDVLVYLVENSDRIVSVEELLSALWPDRVVQESAVHARINQLRSAFEDSPKQSRYIKTVIKRGYQAIAEVHPATEPSKATVAKKIPHRWTVIGAGSALLVLLALIISFPKSPPVTDEDSATASTSIAILPFSNLSASDENGFFADGIHEDLLTSLATSSELKVISRTSVMRYKNSELPIRQIGEELGANYIVEGSVRRQSDEVRVSVQLIDARSDTHIWAGNFDRSLTDVFVVQSEITNEVARLLSVEILSQSPAVYETDVNDVLFQVRPLIREATVESLAQALTQLRRLRDAHETNAEVHAAIARTLWLQTNSTESWSEVGAELRHSLDLALQLDPDLTSALITSANINAYYLDQKTLAEEYYQRALNAAPSSAEALMSYGWFLAVSKREHDLGFYFLRQALEIDPFSDAAWSRLANAYVSAGDLDGSYRAIFEGLERMPDSPALQQRQTQYYLYRGARIQGVASLLSQIQRDPHALPNINLLIDILSRMGLHEAAGLWLQEMQRIGPDHPLTYRAEYNHLWYMNDWDSLSGLTARWENRLDRFGNVAKQQAHLWSLQAKADAFRRDSSPDEAAELYNEIIDQLAGVNLAERLENGRGEVIEFLWLGNMLSHALISTGRSQEAHAVLQSIIDNPAEGGDIRINQAMASAMLGDATSTLIAFRDAVTGPPAGEFGIRLFMASDADSFNGLNRDPEIESLYASYLNAHEERKKRLRVELPALFDPASIF